MIRKLEFHEISQKLPFQGNKKGGAAGGFRNDSDSRQKFCIRGYK